MTIEGSELRRTGGLIEFALLTQHWRAGLHYFAPSELKLGAAKGRLVSRD